MAITIAWMGLVTSVAPLGARAAVIGGTASTSTLVQEVIDGEPGSVTSDAGEADLLAGPLPVLSEAALTSTDLNAMLVSQGRGFAQVDDPTRLDQPNPEELRLEAACYSKAANIEYVVNSSATELRHVVFTTAGSDVADPEIRFNANGKQTIESSVFLSGIVMVWTTGTDVDLTGLEGTVDITITSDAEPVWSTTLAVSVNDQGAPTFDVTGPLTVTELTVDDLAAQETLDAATIDQLRSLAESGTLLMLAIEDQEHPYQYEVTADVPIDLQANMTIDLHTPPGGVGMAATLGGPFENLAQYVTETLPSVDGAAVQRAINAAAFSPSSSDVPGGTTDGATTPTPTGTATPLCGVFGVEGLIGLFLPFGMAVRRRGRA